MSKCEKKPTHLDKRRRLLQECRPPVVHQNVQVHPLTNRQLPSFPVASRPQQAQHGGQHQEAGGHPLQVAAGHLQNCGTAASRRCHQPSTLGGEEGVMV